MSDTEDRNHEEKLFMVDRAKVGRAACKKCKDKCLVGEIRIAKLVASPFGSGKMKNWHHVDCIFEQFLKQRVTTSRIKSIDDLDGLTDLNDEDIDMLTNRINESEKLISEKYGVKLTPNKATKPSSKNSAKKTNYKRRRSSSTNTSLKLDISSDTDNTETEAQSDRSFKDLQDLIGKISSVSSYTDKTNLVKDLFSKGSNGKGFKGNITQWCRLLLPGDIKRIYNLQSKQLIKLFAKIFGADQASMIEYLNKSDIGETIQYFFGQSKKCKPVGKSTLTIQEVDDFLEKLSQMTKADEQMNHFKGIVSKCTSEDLKILIRLIKQDLRINAGAKHILQAIHPDAYQVYQASKDLNSVIKRCWNKGKNPLQSTSVRVKASITIMTPVQPMLAEACKSIEQAMKKCPNGMYAEIKYDGERVQLHKSGNDFKYYSRSLKPVLSHKVSHFKDFIPKAFPYANDLILDSEILMMDATTGKPLPFGTLGVHKKSEFKDANVCLFVFDCIYYNGESLLSKPIDYRKKILQENMNEIPNRIVFSELEVIQKPSQLSKMIAKVLEMGLEGLVLKDLKSIYEPGKRHWLKVKKDYLHDGAMADTADLIVLGAWYGTGKKAGMMSVFLMGCYDEHLQKFCTVTKVHTGHDDKTLEKLQSDLKMIEINSDATKVPSWLKCTKTMIPDFVAENPKKQPVWEITGAEFTQHDVHTADGISIRFPRVTKIRSDKSWQEATTLEEIQKLYQNSKESTDVKLLMDVDDKLDQTAQTSEGRKRKRKKSVSNESNSKVQKAVTTPAEQDDLNVIKEPLPNLFEHVRLLVEEGGKKQFDKWIRYFIAYGGTLVEPESWEEATHVLHLKDSVTEQCIRSPRNARHIILEWIKHTVANGNLEDFRPYSVRWEPQQNALNYKQDIKV